MNSSISLTTQRINEILTKLKEANNPDLTLATILGLVRVLGELERLYEKQIAERMKASR
ncbi:MAG: hypothetical protein ACXQTI_03795 [Candidatus Nezhaarchaeales archaeon]